MRPAWWQKAGIDPGVTARALWLATHPHLAASDDTAALSDKAADTSDRATSSHKQRSPARGPNRKKNGARNIRADDAPQATQN